MQGFQIYYHMLWRVGHHQDTSSKKRHMQMTRLYETDYKLYTYFMEASQNDHEFVIKILIIVYGFI